MRRFAVLFMMGALAAPSFAITVNFDDLIGDNIPVPPNYMGIANMTNWTYYNFAQFPYNPSSGTCRVYNLNNGMIDFGQQVVMVSAFFNGNGDGNGFLPINYDMYLNNVLVATSGNLSLNGNGVGGVLSSGYNGAVDRIQVNGSHGWYIMDDLTYRAVPEPATMLAMGVGLAALLRRRTKR